ncbi:MAG: ribosome maturation factor RimM [Candidatus Paracaedibacteraceae bacterium]|nr:ribosome maturation factor RimM [Candidatus Paracaedibacteraceae bacterium]
MKTVCLGEIVAAHGIKGHVKIKTHTANPSDIGSYGVLKDDKGVVYKLSNVRTANPNSAIAFVQGVIDRNQAEALRGTKLFIEREQLPEPSNDEYYHEDIVGLAVLDIQGTSYGTILGIQDFGAGEFFDISSDAHDKIATLPFHDEAVISIDIDKGIVTIDPEFLLV